MNKNKDFAVVLCAFLAIFMAVFAFDSVLSSSEATTRRAPIRQRAAPSIFASGNGTQRNPFVIRTAAQLSAFAASVNNGETYSDRYIRLGANIDLRNVNWTPIGFYCASGGTRSFNGSFYGAGFSIFHMGAGNDARSPASALFGALNGATIQRVCLQLVNVAGESHVGGLVGFKTGSTLRNSRVSGNVSGRYAVGGIVGSAFNGFLEGCDFSGSVTGVDGVGGLVGTMDRVTIRSARASGQVDGAVDVGGFVGGILDGMIIDSTANGVIVNGDHNVGGFVGNLVDSGRIERAAFTGQVSGNSNVGGIVGRMAAGFVVSCTMNGSVRGRAHAGGIIGEFMSGEIRRSVNSASVDGMFSIGGIAGMMSGGLMRNNLNNGAINGGEAVGGLVGNFYAEDMNFALEANNSTGQARGHFSTGHLVGAQP